MAATTKGTGLADIVGRGLQLGDGLLEASLQSGRYAAYSSNAWLVSNVFPAADALLALRKGLQAKLLEGLRKEREWGVVARDVRDHLSAAMRYQRLVSTFGRKLFGSARFPGEVVVAEDEFFRLSYLPPTESAPREDLAVFHAGGLIPYGDRIFRLTPDFNLYSNFLDRGVGVYAMELHGDRFANDYAKLTLEQLFASLGRLSDAAFEHHGGRKLALEGYCGAGTQAIAWACAEPEAVDRKFHTLATFVAPVDGSACAMIADSIRATPKSLREASMTVWERLGGYVPADSTQVGLDLALGTVFLKTGLGYFAAGWPRTDLLAASSVDQLSPGQQRDLAGAYWISPDCARRFPVSVDVSRYASELFARGISPRGDLPWKHHGQRLSLRALRERTELRVVGFFGGLDLVVPDRTAYPLMAALGDRYRHVVHPQAGHISYVLSTRMWRKEHPRAFKPDPVDVLLETASRA